MGTAPPCGGRTPGSSSILSHRMEGGASPKCWHPWGGGERGGRSSKCWDLRGVVNPRPVRPYSGSPKCEREIRGGGGSLVWGEGSPGSSPLPMMAGGGGAVSRGGGAAAGRGGVRSIEPCIPLCGPGGGQGGPMGLGGRPGGGVSGAEGGPEGAPGLGEGVGGSAPVPPLHPPLPQLRGFVPNSNKLRKI